METVDQCPICCSAESSLALVTKDHTVTQEDFSIRSCTACSFHYTSPRPPKEQIGKYYLSDDYISHAASATSLKDRIYHRVRRRAIRGKHQLIKSYHPAGSVLDVGCGTGDFLAYLKHQGYSVQGVEVSTQARALAEAKNLPVAEVLNSIPAEAQFQVITLWHVLEHVSDLKNTVQQLHERCATNGVVVIAVPDRESWDCQHYGAEWAAWDVPRHLSHFTRDDIRLLIDSSGFELMQIKKMWFDAPYVSMLSEQYRGAGSMSSLIKGAMLGSWSNLISLTSGRPTSSSLYLAKRREGSGSA